MGFIELSTMKTRGVPRPGQARALGGEPSAEGTAPHLPRGEKLMNGLQGANVFANRFARAMMVKIGGSPGAESIALLV